MHRIGRYEVRRELGRGGFGRVYAAFDPTVARMVAIKTLTAVAEPDLLARFRNEASTAGRLRHPNIVTIHDFGEHEGSPYLVMELLEGEDLQSVIAHRRMLSTYDKLRILWEVADGLQHAHAHNILHRDIKPANIMLVGGRQAKLLDFGIAFVTQAAISRLTPCGNMVGTYRYMAPEQFRGDAPDALADIFAYGVVCYELLSGVYPFEAADAAGVMYRIMSTEPSPLGELCPEFPAALEGVVSRILRKEREERYQSLDDVKFDLEPMLLALRRQRVDAVLAEAQMRLSADEITASQALVKEALELDRGSPLARRLRDQIQRELQRRAIQPRLAALVDTAEQKVTERRFDEAMRDLESALRLDPTNAGVLEMIQSVSARRESFRRSEQHSDEAKRALRQRNLTGALDHANEALLADPQNAAAAALLEEIQAELLRREQARRLLHLLGKARGMLLLESYDEAIGLLEGAAQDFPDAVELRDLRARAHADKAAHERELHLLTEIRAAKEMLKRRDFRAAHERLVILQEEFPQTAELQDLLQYAREQWQNERNAQAAEQMMAEAHSLLSVRQFAATIALLERTLDEYPGHVGAGQLLQRAVREKAAFEKKQALEDALSAARRFRDCSRFREAIGILNDYADRYGAEAGVSALMAEIESLLDEPAAPLQGSRGEAAGQRRRAETEISAQAVTELISVPGFNRAVDLTQNVSALFRPAVVAAPDALRSEAERDQPETTTSTDAIPAGDEFMRHGDWRKRIFSRARSFGPAVVVAALAAAAAGIVATRQVRHPSPAPITGRANVPLAPVSSPLPLPVKPQPRGTLAVSTGVPGVEILLNGRKYGRTNAGGLLTITAPAGAYTLQANRKGYSGGEPRRVEIQPDQSERIAILLQASLPNAAERQEPKSGGTPVPAPSGVVSPAIPPRPNLQTLAANEWEDLRETTDPAAIEDFLRRNSGMPVASAATARLEQLLWARVNKEDPGELRRFLARFPKGALAPAAAARIRQIESAQLNPSDRAGSPEGHRPSLPRETVPGGEQEEIARTLRRYNEAFESRSMPQLSAVWPGMPRDTRDSLRSAFKEDRVRYTVHLTPVKAAQIDGDSAVVECERVARTVARNVAKPTQVSRVQVVLTRTNSGWVVHSIRDAH